MTTVPTPESAGAKREMSAEEERDLLARQRDGLLALLDEHDADRCFLVDAIIQAFTHDPADSADSSGGVR